MNLKNCLWGGDGWDADGVRPPCCREGGNLWQDMEGKVWRVCGSHVANAILADFKLLSADEASCAEVLNS